ncbi:MAG TPA: hypothetical protein QGF05_04935 [Dehalococcoidia bacterium]|nr:hypothetical protein [Dehalococcoidia bacterium]
MVTSHRNHEPQLETQSKANAGALADVAAPARKAAKTCAHFWQVSPPQGELSWGSCKKCGKRKRFSNRFDGRDRTNNSDIFSSPGAKASGFKPDRSSTYYDSGVREAFEGTAHTAN